MARVFIAVVAVTLLAACSVALAAESDASLSSHQKLFEALGLRGVAFANKAALQAAWNKLPADCRNRATVLSKTQNRAGAVSTRCWFYGSCLESLFKCGSSKSDPNSYPINYGYKYCSRFISSTLPGSKLTETKNFIHSTLPCLQISIFDAIQQTISGSRTGSRAILNCASLTTFAFDNHPLCYTAGSALGGTSICKIMVNNPTRPQDVASDLWGVAGTVDRADLMSVRSAKQMWEVAKTCTGNISSAVWNAVSNKFVNGMKAIGQTVAGWAGAAANAAGNAWNAAKDWWNSW